MSKAAFVFLLTAVGTPTLHAEVSSGGVFVLDRSLISASAEASTGGNISVTGSMGEGFSHVRGSNIATGAAGRRLLDGFLSPIKSDPTIAGNFSNTQEGWDFEIPGGAFPLPYELSIEPDPLRGPVAGDVSTIVAANRDVLSFLGAPGSVPAALVEIRALLNDGTLHSGSTASPLRLDLSRVDRGDGSLFSSYRLDENAGRWSAVPSSAGGNQERISFPETGLYAVFQAGAMDVAGTYAHPVPWRPNGGNAALYGTAASGITFSHIPGLGSVRIFNMVGELVRDLPIPPGSTQLVWDGKTGSGSDVASGVYIWSVESGVNRKTGKLMVIK